MGWSERISADRTLTAVVIGGLLFLAGCSPSGKTSGSGSGSAAAKRLPPLVVNQAVSLPAGDRQQHLFVKPGHWSSAWVDATSNHEDFQGDLEIRVENRGQTPQGAYQGPASRRPLILPKEEPRSVEGTFFLPCPKSDPIGLASSQNAGFTVSLLPRGRHRSELTATFQTTELKNHQAIFCVLAEQPERYHYLAGLDVITAPQSGQAVAGEVHYRLSIAQVDLLRAPLPSQANGWTTTAYLLWDGYDPTRLTEAQRTAMIDWLHWGGQLLVSGPGSLATLQRSFLEPYLPARDGGTIALEAAALEPLDRWTAPGGTPLNPTHPWGAVKLEPHTRAETLVSAVSADAGPLLVERRIGRGRIVVSAFSLSEFDLADWPSFDTLLNGLLMRRPPRSVVRTPEMESLRWFDQAAWFEPTRISNLRYVAHDEGRERRNGETPSVAAWRDDGAVVKRARELLRAEARVVIPEVRFVVYVVGAYFFILVPFNWLVFRLMGKPEWAWFAAPLIAVGCSIAVIRLAELDVGFARSSSETVVVELQPDYSRAHVTRFTAVYNSLGTEYEIRGEDPATIALPMAPDDDDGNGKKEGEGGPAARDTETSDPANWRIGRVTEGERDHALIDGFLVESNLVEFLRAEHPRDVGGGMRCEQLDDGRFRITNGTRLELTDCRITGVRSGHIDRLPAGATVELEFGGPSPRRKDDVKLSLAERMRLVLEGSHEEEIRLTATTTDDVGGLTISPQPSQVKRTTFVVAHLEYYGTKIQKDYGIRKRVRRPFE